MGDRRTTHLPDEFTVAMTKSAFPQHLPVSLCGRTLPEKRYVWQEGQEPTCQMCQKIAGRTVEEAT